MNLRSLVTDYRALLPEGTDLGVLSWLDTSAGLFGRGSQVITMPPDVTTRLLRAPSSADMSTRNSAAHLVFAGWSKRCNPEVVTFARTAGARR